jgi:hypothetical protein
MLLGECDDSTGSLDTETREMLVGKLLRADPTFSVHDHAVSQDARAFDDRQARHFARNPFNVRAISPINVFHVRLGEGERVS